MANIVLIDDTTSILQLVSLYLKAAGHQVFTAADGFQGLRVIQENPTDLVITDVMMPGMDGYELTRRLRNEPATAHLPIMTLTAHSELENKIKAFEAGADDFVSKPFEASDLVARVNGLLQRVAVAKERAASNPPPIPHSEKSAHLIAVHSLRGGVGCSTLAVNLALGLTGLWNDSVLLADFVTTTGQVGLMLNLPLKRTWAELLPIPVAKITPLDLSHVITKHESGLGVLMAPTEATLTTSLEREAVDKILQLARPQYGYLVVEIAHDFSAVSLGVLEQADEILLVLAPDLASIRAATAALEMYKQLEIPRERIRVVLNWTFAQQGFPRDEIEQALEMPVNFVIPYAPLTFVNAINRGAPPLFEKPQEPISALLEDLAFYASSDMDRASTPYHPKPGWQRVHYRLAANPKK